ncbi:MAG: hypothetical protein JO026_01140 [Patescibacteria group bacterium]|nr:hypothetical protein [Patescibacteria group bacterium]
MSRVKITEYRAKKILLGAAYEGIPILESRIPDMPYTKYVLKVDQGVKKRFKQGLVALDISKDEVSRTLSLWREKGFTRFLAEPYFPHEQSEEKYLSLERVREGIRVLFAEEGGIDIEEHPEKVRTFLISSPEESERITEATGLPISFFAELVQKFEDNYFAFLEINPLVIRGNEVHLLDAAALVDSAAVFFKPGWSETDIIEANVRHRAEENVRQLQKTTPASLKLTILNPDGNLFLLLSGGGGSIVIADEAALQNSARLLGNYGEYSGGPTREETYLYTKEILSLIKDSKAKKKALVIAGGIANFTDVKSTFSGIIDALSEEAPSLRKEKIRVYIRRGGPNEVSGLSLMEEFLKKEDLLGSIHGSSAPITLAIDEALSYVRS